MSNLRDTMYPSDLKKLRLDHTAFLFIELRDDNKDEIINDIGNYNFKIMKLIKREGTDIVLLCIKLKLDSQSCKKNINYVTDIKNKIKAVRCKIMMNVTMNDVKPIKNSAKYSSNYLESIYKMNNTNKEIDIKEFVNKINKHNKEAHIGITLDPSDGTYFITKQCRHDGLNSIYKCAEKIKKKFLDMGGLIETDIYYVWYDDNKKLDEGWCDKTETEEECISDDDMYDDHVSYKRMRNHIDNLIKIQKLYGSEDNVNT